MEGLERAFSKTLSFVRGVPRTLPRQGRAYVVKKARSYSESNQSCRYPHPRHRSVFRLTAHAWSFSSKPPSLPALTRRLPVPPPATGAEQIKDRSCPLCPNDVVKPAIAGSGTRRHVRSRGHLRPIGRTTLVHAAQAPHGKPTVSHRKVPE